MRIFGAWDFSSFANCGNAPCKQLLDSFQTKTPKPTADHYPQRTWYPTKAICALRTTADKNEFAWSPLLQPKAMAAKKSATIHCGPCRSCPSFTTIHRKVLHYLGNVFPFHRTALVASSVGRRLSVGHALVTRRVLSIASWWHIHHWKPLSRFQSWSGLCRVPQPHVPSVRRSAQHRDIACQSPSLR